MTLKNKLWLDSDTSNRNAISGWAIISVVHIAPSKYNFNLCWYCFSLDWFSTAFKHKLLPKSSPIPLSLYVIACFILVYAVLLPQIGHTSLIKISFGAYDPTPHGPKKIWNFFTCCINFFLKYFLAYYALKASNFETIVILVIIKSIWGLTSMLLVCCDLFFFNFVRF